MPVQLSAVGDIALSGKIAEGIVAHGPGWPLERVRDALSTSDLLVANFEFPFTRLRRPFLLSVREHMFADPANVVALDGVRWSVFSLATNHALDWGPEGIAATRELLGRSGALVVGAGRTLQEAGAPAVLTNQGIRFGFLAYCKRGDYSAGPGSAGANPLTAGAAVRDIRVLKQAGVNHVVVSLHWGVEFSSYPSGEDVRVARALVDAGASLLIGHHPHTLQGIERYGRGVIAYSLGNFIADMTLDRPPREEAWRLGFRGGILRVPFEAETVGDPEFVPTLIDDAMQTVVPDENSSRELRRDLLRISAGIGTDKFYESALPNLAGREARAWLARIREHGPAGVLLLLRTLKWRHLRMVLGYAGVMIKRLIGVR